MGCPMKNQPMFLAVISTVILSAAISNASAENIKPHYKQYAYHKTSRMVCLNSSRGCIIRELRSSRRDDEWAYSEHRKPKPHIYEFGE
jgi:hypothetical protein